MTVETTVQRMFDRYPDLFATRKECYNHLFCVIGNGYAWKRGQIVECCEDGEIEPFIIEAEDRDYAAQAAEPTVARQSEENIRKHDAEMDILRGAGVMEPSWYPLCELSLINRVPEDARPDWRKAADECREMLKADGIKL